MSDFSYAVVSSVLHDRAAVDAIFSAYEPFFAGLDGRRIELKPLTAGDSDGGTFPPLFFILTGGTEGIVLDYLSSLPHSPSGKAFPLVIVAHTHHNSLPAALEIAARARQDGGTAIVIQMKSPDDDAARNEIVEAVAVSRAIASMRNSKIGAIGEPSDWLVASSQKAATVSSAWGATIESVAFRKLREAIDNIRDGDAKAAGAEGSAILEEKFRTFLEESSYLKEPAKADMYKSDTIYRALRQMAAERKLDGLTLRCFDLVLLDQSTGCFALSQLADDGIDAGCEGDIPSILALRWMRLLSGRAAWMANPSEISLDKEGKRGSVLLAHCTVPRSLLASFGIRSHFESGLGVAIAGNFQPGPVTLVRLGGVGLDKAWVAEGYLTACPSDEGLCRTQALIEIDNADLAKLLAEPLGNHIVVGFGAWAKRARRYLSMEKIEEI